MVLTLTTYVCLVTPPITRLRLWVMVATLTTSVVQFQLHNTSLVMDYGVNPPVGLAQNPCNIYNNTMLNCTSKSSTSKNSICVIITITMNTNISSLIYVFSTSFYKNNDITQGITSIATFYVRIYANGQPYKTCNINLT